MSRVSVLDTLIIMGTATAVVCGVALTYATVAEKARLLLKSELAQKGLNIVAGSVMMGTGIFLMTKP